MSDAHAVGLAWGLLAGIALLPALRLAGRTLYALGVWLLDFPPPLTREQALAAETAEELARQYLEGYEADIEPWPGYFVPEAMRRRALERVARSARELVRGGTRRQGEAIVIERGALFDALAVTVHRLETDAPPSME